MPLNYLHPLGAYISSHIPAALSHKTRRAVALFCRYRVQIRKHHHRHC